MANGNDDEEELSGFTDTGAVSSAFASIQYNQQTKQAAITFAKDGRRYMIEGIEANEVHRWVNSGSPGGYYNSFIKGVY